MLKNKKLVVVIPHSHTWFWVQTCVTTLIRNMPRATGFDIRIVVVDNSPWSPAIRGIKDTWLGGLIHVVPNHKSNKFHASALDCIVEKYDFDYLMALETDVLALRPTWLQWFVDQMKPTDYAVGMWHHEQFVNPSCTLYRGDVLRMMDKWCKDHPDPNTLRWGPEFRWTAPLDGSLRMEENPVEILQGLREWIAGPFAEKRGWPAGTELKESPSGQCKGPGWYEPGQQLHHWAVEAGYTYTVCPSITTKRSDGVPLQTMYGESITDPRRQLEASELFDKAETVHLWGGTRALDVIKHPVTCEFVKSNTPAWLAREARFWKAIVPVDIQEQTLAMIRQCGWHITGQGTDHVSARDREAVEFVRGCYKEGGVQW